MMQREPQRMQQFGMDVIEQDEQTITQELELVAEQNGGLLRAEDVVEFARDSDTALHARFTWDDSEAARQHRIFQARNIIRANVRIIPHASEPIRAFVSLIEDRKQEGGGYRPMVQVLSDDELRARLVKQASDELRRVRRAYGHLKELATIWEAIDAS